MNSGFGLEWHAPRGTGVHQTNGLKGHRREMNLSREVEK